MRIAFGDVALLGFWMDARRVPGDCRFRAFAIKIKPVLPSVCSPCFFKILYVLALADAECGGDRIEAQTLM
jgi:hypothetical protein